MHESKDEPLLGRDAWAQVADEPGWLLLMEPGGKLPRSLVSDQDEYFVLSTARALFPGKRVRIVSDAKTGRKYLLRQA